MANDTPENDENAVDPMDTEAGREAYFDDVMNNPDQTAYDNDVIGMKLTDTGHQGAAQEIMDMADTTGGKLGSVNASMAQAVDQTFEARKGSRESDVSVLARMAEADPQTIDPDDATVLVENEILNEHPQADEDVYDAMFSGDGIAILSALAEIARGFDMGNLDGFVQDIMSSQLSQGNARAADYMAPLESVLNIGLLEPEEQFPKPTEPSIEQSQDFNQIFAPPSGSVS